MSRLQHDGLLRPRDLVESDLGVGLVYDYDQSWQRLDLWLAGRPNGVPLTTQLSIVRQIGEALQYAHDNRVVHRGLSPLAVWVRDGAGDGRRQGAGRRLAGGGRTDAASLTGTPTSGSPHCSARPGHRRAPRAGRRTVRTVPTEPSRHDTDRWLADAFAAPEGRWSPDADRVRLDVFGLGALAFYLVTGRPRRPGGIALRTRLRDQHGLDLAIELPQVPADAAFAGPQGDQPGTQPAHRRRPDRPGPVRRRRAGRPRATTARRTDPLEAAPDTVLDGRFRLVRRLGRGSTAVGLLVRDQPATAPDVERVLKVALDEQPPPALDDEAEVLRLLDYPRVVKLVEDAARGRRAAGAAAGERRPGDPHRRPAHPHPAVPGPAASGSARTCSTPSSPSTRPASTTATSSRPTSASAEGRGDRTKHLVLFDFSLTRAAASATRRAPRPTSTRS